MDIDQLIGFLKSRRSIRKFKPDPIPDECIEKIIESARWAPSGANAQPWEFIIVKDPQTRAKMVDIYHQCHLEEYFYIENTRIEAVRHNKFKASGEDLPGFKDAPVLIVVCGDRRILQASTLAARFIGTEGGGGDATYLKGVSNATFCMHLAAASLGLGSQWVSVTTQYEQLLKPLLQVPVILQIHTIVPLGYTAYEPLPSYRREPEEFVHYEKYDLSKYRHGEQIIQYINKLRGHTKAAYAQGHSLR